MAQKPRYLRAGRRGRRVNTIVCVELRRALLLFAIVLGLAALVASLARPPEDEGEGGQPVESRATDGAPPTAAPRPKADTPTIAIRAGGDPEVRELTAGEPATLLVEVREPGQVSIPSLGLLQPAEPLTPARFDVLVTEPGRHPVELDPVAPDAEGGTVGALRVVPAR
jgi:hypothetical protein